MTKAIFIVGPTATGKSSLAVLLAQTLDGEVINADSMQIYRQLNIGTAKPKRSERESVPHHLYDIINVGEPYSAAQYRKDAFDTMKKIDDRKKLSIVCGGTGLFINAISYQMDFTGSVRSEEIRERWKVYAAIHGNTLLHEKLQTIDTVSANRIHPNDVKRLIRALEIYELTGIPLSMQNKQFSQLVPEECPMFFLGLTEDRAALYRRIVDRVDDMLEQGLVSECQELFHMGIPLTHPSMLGIGYRQVFRYLSGEYSYERMVELIKQETQRYAKRQFAWFRRDERIHWLDIGQYKDVDSITVHALKLLRADPRFLS